MFFVRSSTADSITRVLGKFQNSRSTCAVKKKAAAAMWLTKLEQLNASHVSECTLVGPSNTIPYPPSLFSFASGYVIHATSKHHLSALPSFQKNSDYSKYSSPRKAIRIPS